MKAGIIRTALPLTAEQRALLRGRFEAKLGQPLDLREVVEPSLIGGVAVDINGITYDGSIRSALDAASSNLHGMEPIRILDGQPPDADFTSVGAALWDRLSGIKPATIVRGTGKVLRTGDGVTTVSGLSGCRLNEMVEFEGGGYGIAMNLEENSVEVVMLGDDTRTSDGQRAWGTGQVLSVPTGDELLGRVVDPLGVPLDGGLPIHSLGLRPIEAPAPSLLARKPVSRPLETGLISIDAMIPIGKGQRELIIGDRQTGKTTIAIDAIINQKGKNIACFYVAIGQKASSVAQIVELLRSRGAMDYTCVVCATASDSPTMQYIAPYSACAMAERRMADGGDALIVYDDLSKHAVTYRTLSLLLRRPPGREAYPGDVFYLHARLLERAAQLSDEHGGGSLTALPIIETQGGDISAYIPTNVISITDGQIFLDAELFREGHRPAVNSGLSVSRVGGAAQTQAMRKAVGQLRLELAQYREMQVFSRFSSDMDKSTKDMLMRGERLDATLCQDAHAPLSEQAQAAMLFTLTRGLLPKDIPMDALERWKRSYPGFLNTYYAALMRRIESGKRLEQIDEDDLRAAAAEWMREEDMNANGIAGKAGS
ncbi:MAG: F0F1 ATP synthase subunit alpha [Oscillospiraceae bacterium]|jgi:F-type H+-transporting ATPase subunit alpha|nr:F0F1 ATP synthase subunit alpha [Oscillospiraceae bacterium]